MRRFVSCCGSVTFRAQRSRAQLYFGCAEKDRWVPPSMVAALQQELQQARAQGNTGFSAEVEIYPGTQHGFAFPDRSIYDKAAGERHWERLFALFARSLQAG